MTEPNSSPPPDADENNGDGRAPLSFGRRLARALVLGARKFSHDHCSLLAAAMSFYALLAIVPTCFLVIWGLAHILHNPSAHQIVADLVNENVPTGSETWLLQVRWLENHAHVWMKWGKWSLVPLLWAALRFYDTLARILTAAWGGNGLRSWWLQKMVGLLTFVAVLVFFAGSLVITSVLTAIRNWDISVFGYRPGDFAWFWYGVNEVAPFAISVLMFFLLYKFLPNARVRWRTAFTTALIVGVLWEASKAVFADYILHSDTYRYLYGPLSGAIFLMLWVFLSTVLLLLGAEMAAAYQQLNADGSNADHAADESGEEVAPPIPSAEEADPAPSEP